MSNDIIHIAICFDDRYFRYALVLIESILKFNQRNEIFFHLVLDDMQDSKVKIIHQMILESGNAYKRYFIPKNIEENLNTDILKKHPLSNFHRYLLIHLIDDDVKKVIYLDTDILVNGDLQELWNVEIGNYELAAVLDAHIMEFENKMLLELFDGKVGNYFNAGVLLLKTDYWRNIENLNYFIETTNKCFPHFPDQNALNFLLREKTLQLPPKYNFYNTISEFPINRFEGIYGKNEIREAFRNPIIIHFTYLKPDQKNCFHKGKKYFWKFLENSQFENYFEKPTFSEKLKIYIFSITDPKNRGWVMELKINLYSKFFKLISLPLLESKLVQSIVKLKSNLLRNGIINE